MTFPRSEHHAVLPQADRLRVTIDRDMAYGEGHINVRSHGSEASR